VFSPTHLSLRLLQLPTHSSLAAAHGVPTTSFRMLTLVGLHVDNDLDRVVGWGECSALNEAGYTPEWAEGAFELLRSGAPFTNVSAPMATAAIEQGYRRIKIKIAPGRIVDPVAAVRSSFPGLELHVDANASLRQEDLPALMQLRDLGVRVVEQPFSVDDRHMPARLIAETDLDVAADEAVQSPADVDALAANQAATAIAVKPSKLGGIHAALDVLDQVHAAGMRATIGGMLESGLGRHVLAALAPLPAFTLVGDLSPAGRWLADDPFPDITMRSGMIAAPSRLGIAGEPFANRLERYTVRRATVTAATALAAVTNR